MLRLQGLSFLFHRRNLDTGAPPAPRDPVPLFLRLAQARLNELLALVQIYKALGGGWQQ